MLEPTADLCATLMELPHTAGLVELALIRREMGEVEDESPETYGGPGSTIDGFWPEEVSAAREHMLSLLRLEALELQLFGAAAAPGRAGSASLKQRLAPVQDEARRAGLRPDGSDDKGLMDDLSGDI